MKGVIKIKLELLDIKYIRQDGCHYHGVIEKKIYSCPCGKGTVEYEEADIPGNRDWYTQIKCEECKKKYEIENYLSPSWKIVAKK